MKAVVIHVPNGLSYKLADDWYDAGEDGYYYKPDPPSRLRDITQAIGSVLACFHIRKRYIEERELNIYESLLYTKKPDPERPWRKVVTIEGEWVRAFKSLDYHVARLLKKIEEYQR